MMRHIRLLRGRRWAVTIAVVAILASSRVPLNAQNAGLSGVVKNASGEAVAGALVKVISEKPGLSFMVVSQEQGQYSTPNLLPGRYTVQAFGADSQSAQQGPVEMAGGRPGKMDLVLTAPLQISPREKPLTDEGFAKLLPDANNPFIRDKFKPICSECHSLEWVLSARKTPEGWRDLMDRMQYSLLGYRPPLHYKYPIQGVEDLQMTKYLSENFGPNVPVNPPAVHLNRNLPGTLLKGAAAKYVAMEFSLPPGSAPSDVAVDSHGVAWVTEGKTGKLGRFDPASQVYSRVAAPAGKNSEFRLRSVAIDPQDQVWFADDGPKDARILQYNPKSRGFNSYAVPDYQFPLPPATWPRIGMLGFTDGNVWAAGMVTDRILKVDTNTRKVSHYPVPRGSVPFALRISSSKMIWFTGEVSNRVYKLDPNDLGGEGLVSQWEAPTLRSDLRGLGMDATGNLWMAAMNLGKLLKMDTDGKFTEYVPPSEDSGPFAVDVDAKRGLIWFSEVYSDKLARFDSKSKTFVEFPHASADSEVQRIEIDRTNPNRVWWTSARLDKIGYIQVME